ncbi:hypothetical protein CONLIGDRAFT_647387 [Coniochaeta ligniaria NRRL 30616]|uniref:Uncharacterized protein n=1 Tax=Coniochaeta ligniaria NRRL 30616 TaxID=1408157 RepID=A0A1J7IE03_9PEZI|nr:hypothetical protein CONLIGDRAFT_647387 [Coniochaeta ligniaria NRRL 30616]
MANVIGFGLDIAINIAVLAEAFAPRDAGPVAMVGVGSQALGQSVSVPDKETPAGPMPHITLYDSHGRNFASDTAFSDGLVDGDNKQVHFQEGVDNDNLRSDPQYSGKENSPDAVRLLAFQNDATCISYVTVTGVDGAHTSWHAGYAKQCGAPWYPSPEIFPTTSFVPGCVWLTNNAKFPGLQAISFKLNDLSFQSTEESQAAQAQFTDFPETLCNAPGRMAFWKTSDNSDCIPFYDFIEPKNETTGFDADFRKIQTGHTMRCTPAGKMWVPPTASPFAGSFGGVGGSIPSSQVGQPPPSPTATQGDGSFGGVAGSIPISQAGQASPSPTTTRATESSATSANPPPKAVQTIANAGNQGAVIVSFNPGGPTGTTEHISAAATASDSAPKARRSSHPRSRRVTQDISSALQRRATLRSAGDYCVDRLAISHLPAHTATEVCRSTTSWGPDFVSVVEGLYCDMCERMLWNLCSGATGTYCFDLERRELRLPVGEGGGGRVARDLGGAMAELEGLRKRYAKVDEWK